MKRLKKKYRNYLRKLKAEHHPESIQYFIKNKEVTREKYFSPANILLKNLQQFFSVFALLLDVVGSLRGWVEKAKTRTGQKLPPQKAENRRPSDGTKEHPPEPFNYGPPQRTDALLGASPQRIRYKCTAPAMHDLPPRPSGGSTTPRTPGGLLGAEGRLILPGIFIKKKSKKN